MLEVVEPVDESRTAIAFATEPIFASLSNLLGNYENLPQVSEDIRKFELDELEVLLRQPTFLGSKCFLRSNARRQLLGFNLRPGLCTWKLTATLCLPVRFKKDYFSLAKVFSFVTTTPRLFTETSFQMPFL